MSAAQSARVQMPERSSTLDGEIVVEALAEPIVAGLVLLRHPAERDRHPAVHILVGEEADRLPELESAGRGDREGVGAAGAMVGKAGRELAERRHGDEVGRASVAPEFILGGEDRSDRVSELIGRELPVAEQRDPERSAAQVALDDPQFRAADGDAVDEVGERGRLALEMVEVGRDRPAPGQLAPSELRRPLLAVAGDRRTAIRHGRRTSRAGSTAAPFRN